MIREHLSFDSEFRALRADWTQVKTGKLKVVFWNNHAKDYVACPFNAFYAHLVTSRAQQPVGSFLFADLCELHSPSTKIGESYREFYADLDNPFVSDVPSDITGSVHNCHNTQPIFHAHTHACFIRETEHRVGSQQVN